MHGVPREQCAAGQEIAGCYDLDMVIELPGWVVSEEASIREEMAGVAGKSPAELWQLTTLCAQDALWAAHASAFGARALELRDPLPESTLRALERLRESLRT